jgi:hypothetical protein
VNPFHFTAPEPALVSSICRCGSTEEHFRRASEADSYRAQSSIETAKKDADKRVAEAEQRYREAVARNVNPDDYKIEKVERVGPHLVLQVRYPSCAKCEFEGLKTMVFLNVSEADALRWRRIDPHFRDMLKTAILDVTVAPSPAARYPGNENGWIDAVNYAHRKVGAA